MSNRELTGKAGYQIQRDGENDADAGEIDDLGIVIGQSKTKESHPAHKGVYAYEQHNDDY
jgi:hypothetical protein